MSAFNRRILVYSFFLVLVLHVYTLAVLLQLKILHFSSNSRGQCLGNVNNMRNISFVIVITAISSSIVNHQSSDIDRTYALFLIAETKKTRIDLN